MTSYFTPSFGSLALLQTVGISMVCSFAYGLFGSSHRKALERATHFNEQRRA